jgi:hypothetical protein
VCVGLGVFGDVGVIGVIGDNGESGVVGERERASGGEVIGDCRNS